MGNALLIDFGSTNTKVTAVDLENAALLGTADSFTTVDTDINEGLAVALDRLFEQTGPLDFSLQLACSSAAGGLRMITSGLVPELTAEAARTASFGAGAKVIRVYAFKLTPADVAEIAGLRPDIFLLTGGIDGGDSACILHNAQAIAASPADFPVVIAGNRGAAQDCARILQGREVYLCENVMPRLGVLNIEPVQGLIRELFLSRIIQAKGLSKVERLVEGILMPTPSAALRALELLARGTARQGGLGELAAVDLGGATTDAYSIAAGLPKRDDTVLKGLPPPYVKRTVEGDIGMRYSAAGILEATGPARLAALSGLTEEQVEAMLRDIAANPGLLPESPAQQALDFALAAAAVDIAMTRHAGCLEQVYTPLGPAYCQNGKDLREVQTLVVTGGAIVHHQKAAEIAAFGLYHPGRPGSLKPCKAAVYIDRKYILAAMGLLGEAYPEVALTIMKKELEADGTIQYSPER